jgi:hypothetical protein
MVVVVEGFVGAADLLVSVPTHWRRKRMTEASAWHRGRWGWRQRPAALKFPAGFLPGKDRRAPSGTTGRVPRA